MPRGAIQAGHLVLCPGPWTGALVPELADVLRVTRICNVELDSPDPAAVAPPSLGVFSVEVPDVGLLYGIPAVNGRGLKVGLDDGPEEDISSPPPPVSEAEAEKLVDLVRRFIPAGVGHCNRGQSPGPLIVGAYPDGADYDTKLGEAGEHEAAKRAVAAVGLPSTDPVGGGSGPLLRLWR